jgi:RNA polymerase sigma factor (sigma-70 family)
MDNAEMDAVALRLQERYDETDAVLLLEHCRRMIGYHSRRFSIPGLSHDDVAQEMRIAVLGAVSTWNPQQADFGYWGEKHCRWRTGKLWHDAVRRNGQVMSRTEQLSDGIAASEPDRHRDEDVADLRRRLELALARSSDTTRRVIELRLQGLMCREVAAQMGFSHQSVRAHIARFKETCGQIAG